MKGRNNRANPLPANTNVRSAPPGMVMNRSMMSVAPPPQNYGVPPQNGFQQPIYNNAFAQPQPGFMPPQNNNYGMPPNSGVMNPSSLPPNNVRPGGIQPGVIGEYARAAMDPRLTKVERDMAAIFEERISKLELFAAVSNATSHDKIDSAELETRFKLIAEEISALKKTFIELQQFTMDINKQLLEQLQYVNSQPIIDVQDETKHVTFSQDTA